MAETSKIEWTDATLFGAPLPKRCSQCRAIKTGMALRHDLAIGNSLDPIAVTFVMVEQAARLIAAADPAAAAAAIRQGIDASFYTDPTLAQRYLAQREDMERKLAILDDAARLIGNWNVVRENAGG